MFWYASPNESNASTGVKGVVSVVSDVVKDHTSDFPIPTYTLVAASATSSLKFSAFTTLKFYVTIAVIFLFPINWYE
jgi:hypothetical protein